MAASSAAAAAATVVAFFGTQVDELLVLSLMFARAGAPGARSSTADVATGYALACLVVIGASAVGATAGAAPPSADRYVRLLGLLPLFIGGRTLVKRERRRCGNGRRPFAAAATSSSAAEAVAAPLLADSTHGESAEVGSCAVIAPPPPPPPAPPAPTHAKSRLAAAAAHFLRPGVAESFAVLLAAGAEEVATFFPLFATRSGAAAATTAVILPLLSAAWLFAAWALARAPGVAAVAEAWGEAAEPWLLIAVAAFCLVGSWIIPVNVPWSQSS